VIRLFDLPHHEARQKLGDGALVFLSFDPVEFHGPHLPLGCDRLIGHGLMRDFAEHLAAELDCEILLAEPVECGVEPTSGPGSRRLKFGNVRAIVKESCRALIELGAQRAVLNTFHGSALHNLAIQDGVDLFRAANLPALAPFHIVLREMVDLDAERYRDAFAEVPEEHRQAMIDGLRMDFHAGFFETSLALHYAKSHVTGRLDEVQPCPPFGRVGSVAFLSKVVGLLGAKQTAKEMSFAADALGWPELRPFPAYTGRPAFATPRAGEVFASKILERYVEAATDVFVAGKTPPDPVMGWLKWFSLGGHIESTKVPVKHVRVDF